MNIDDVKRIAHEHGSKRQCKLCSVFDCAGWESFPSFATGLELARVGSLLAQDENEPTLDEYHPAGTNYWSESAPIALAFFPYTRCEVWQCRECEHPFLRYTEYGGYYEDQRIRAIDPALIV